MKKVLATMGLQLPKQFSPRNLLRRGLKSKEVIAENSRKINHWKIALTELESNLDREQEAFGKADAQILALKLQIADKYAVKGDRLRAAVRKSFEKV